MKKLILEQCCLPTVNMNCGKTLQFIDTNINNNVNVNSLCKFLSIHQLIVYNYLDLWEKQ